MICFILRSSALRRLQWGEERTKSHLEERRRRKEICPPSPVKWYVEEKRGARVLEGPWLNPENKFRVHYKTRFKIKLFFFLLYICKSFLSFNIHREIHRTAGVPTKSCQTSYFAEVLAAVSDAKMLAMSSLKKKMLIEHTVVSACFVDLSG